MKFRNILVPLNSFLFHCHSLNNSNIARKKNSQKNINVKFELK